MNKESLLREFRKKQYRFFGNGDAAIQVCEWNKKALRGKGHCYKQDFYGAHCISCHQITPSALWCNNSCVFCWRPMEYMRGKPPSPLSPEKMIEGLIEERKILISGFKSSGASARKRYDEAMEEKHWAISLSGEPTLYKKLPQLISLLKKRPKTETVFLVSNGQNPKMLFQLWEKNSLPTQLYISIAAPNKGLYRKITCNTEKNGWKNYLKSLALLKLLPCRTVIRLTLIKELNYSEETLCEFAEVLEAVQSDFIEVKAYMNLGFSRRRLKYEAMPSHSEVKAYSEQLLEKMPSYAYESEKKESRIVLLKKRKSRFKTKIIERD
ncbi:MAG: 4-demethylwyosine synthase TYW1 [Candidatus Diapherotrites archaeon]|nr:4-demethylwyosine synthase TYW1 [Candidatus Diapherotrites archaeon]